MSSQSLEVGLGDCPGAPRDVHGLAMRNGYEAVPAAALPTKDIEAVKIASPTDPLRELSRDHSPHVTDEGACAHPCSTSLRLAR